MFLSNLNGCRKRKIKTFIMWNELHLTNGKITTILCIPSSQLGNLLSPRSILKNVFRPNLTCDLGISRVVIKPLTMEALIMEDKKDHKFTSSYIQNFLLRSKRCLHIIQSIEMWWNEFIPWHLIPVFFFSFFIVRREDKINNYQKTGKYYLNSNTLALSFPLASIISYFLNFLTVFLSLVKH